MPTHLESRQFDGPQHVRDWMAFERYFREREGFSPSPGDSRAQSLFHYFTAGAHEEFMGRLTTVKDMPASAYTDPQG